MRCADDHEILIDCGLNGDWENKREELCTKESEVFTKGNRLQMVLKQLYNKLFYYYYKLICNRNR